MQLREVIENMHADGYVQESIAAAVGVDQSTVSRELRRRPGAYAARPCHAQAQSPEFDSSWVSNRVVLAGFH